jgi:hypothetical protein
MTLAATLSAALATLTGRASGVPLCVFCASPSPNQEQHPVDEPQLVGVLCAERGGVKVETGRFGLQSSRPFEQLSDRASQ